MKLKLRELEVNLVLMLDEIKEKRNFDSRDENKLVKDINKALYNIRTLQQYKDDNYIGTRLDRLNDELERLQNLYIEHKKKFKSIF